MPSYEKFFQDVKEDLKKHLACYELTDQEFDDYLKKEEGQIQGAYEDMIEENGEDADMTPEAHYKAAVSTISYCLEMCY
jgi:hypothetical protein